MKFLPITILLTLLVTGCKQDDPLAFISEYHADAEQCSQSIDQHNASDSSKSQVEEQCQRFSQQAKPFEKELNSLTQSHALALEQSDAHRAMLSDIMKIGFKYSLLNSSADDKVVVLSSPNVIRVTLPSK